MSCLHVDVSGEGPDLVLLHGWGMHSGLWGPWLKRLQCVFRVHAVDLPGHGFSSPASNNSLYCWTEAVLQVVPERAAWIGWSLGGLVSQSAAFRFPGRVTHLMLLASTPRFVADTDWPEGVDPNVLDQFSRQLEQDAEKTLFRFLALQVRGSARGGEVLRYLRDGLQQRPMPTSSSLAAGLEILRRTDLRSEFRHYKDSCLLLGERDTLVPASLAGIAAGVRSMVVKGAGHTLFLSHADQCVDYVRQCFVGDE